MVVLPTNYDPRYVPAKLFGYCYRPYEFRPRREPCPAPPPPIAPRRVTRARRPRKAPKDNAKVPRPIIKREPVERYREEEADWENAGETEEQGLQNLVAAQEVTGRQRKSRRVAKRKSTNDLCPARRKTRKKSVPRPSQGSKFYNLRSCPWRPLNRNILRIEPKRQRRPTKKSKDPPPPPPPQQVDTISLSSEDEEEEQGDEQAEEQEEELEGEEWQANEPLDLSTHRAYSPISNTPTPSPVAFHPPPTPYLHFAHQEPNYEQHDRNQRFDPFYLMVQVQPFEHTEISQPEHELAQGEYKPVDEEYEAYQLEDEPPPLEYKQPEQPQVENELFPLEYEQPQVENEPLLLEYEQPQVENELFPLEYEQPQVENEQSQAENKPLQAGNEPPQAGDEPQLIEENPHQHLISLQVRVGETSQEWWMREDCRLFLKKLIRRIPPNDLEKYKIYLKRWMKRKYRLLPSVYDELTSAQNLTMYHKIDLIAAIELVLMGLEFGGYITRGYRHATVSEMVTRFYYPGKYVLIRHLNEIDQAFIELGQELAMPELSGDLFNMLNSYQPDAKGGLSSENTVFRLPCADCGAVLLSAAVGGVTVGDIVTQYQDWYYFSEQHCCARKQHNIDDVTHWFNLWDVEVLRVCGTKGQATLWLAVARQRAEWHRERLLEVQCAPVSPEWGYVWSMAYTLDHWLWYYLPHYEDTIPEQEES